MPYSRGHMICAAEMKPTRIAGKYQEPPLGFEPRTVRLQGGSSDQTELRGHLVFGNCRRLQLRTPALIVPRRVPDSEDAAASRADLSTRSGAHPLRLAGCLLPHCLERMTGIEPA